MLGHKSRAITITSAAIVKIYINAIPFTDSEQILKSMHVREQQRYRTLEESTFLLDALYIYVYISI